MLEKILELIFPPRCELCYSVGKYICNQCYKKLRKYELKKEEEDSFFLYEYDGLIRKKLIQYKFDGRSYLCNFFSECILNNKTACEFISQYDEVMPVPLHRKRKNERGYNQSELIAIKVVNELNKKNFNSLKNPPCIKVNRKCLKKIKNTKPQSEKKLEDRINSVKGIYIVKNKKEIEGKKVLLFDDIYTTGNTCNECKKVLLSAGVSRIGIFTVAKDFLK